MIQTLKTFTKVKQSDFEMTLSHSVYPDADLFIDVWFSLFIIATIFLFLLLLLPIQLYFIYLF